MSDIKSSDLEQIAKEFYGRHPEPLTTIDDIGDAESKDIVKSMMESAALSETQKDLFKAWYVEARFSEIESLAEAFNIPMNQAIADLVYAAKTFHDWNNAGEAPAQRKAAE